MRLLARQQKQPRQQGQQEAAGEADEQREAATNGCTTFGLRHQGCSGTLIHLTLKEFWLLWVFGAKFFLRLRRAEEGLAGGWGPPPG